MYFSDLFLTISLIYLYIVHRIAANIFFSMER